MAGRKLKVFQAQFGFYETVVAAASRAAALRAWGIHQDLFASGQARPTEDPQAVEAALAHPETPLRRAVGSSDAFAVDPTSLPEVPDAPRKASPAAPGKAKPEPSPHKPPADRSALDAAEVALRAVDEGRKREEAELRRKQEELEAARSAAQATYVKDRKRATAAVVQARQAYRKAGGED